MTTLALFGVSMPTFWFGILLILLFSLYLGWLPASGFVPLAKDPVRHLQTVLMPSLSLGVFLAGSLARFSRNSMVETMALGYVRTARAKGLANSTVLWVHALRNSLIPTVTVLGSQFGALLGGAVIVEQVFAYPGVGTLLLTAISQRDYPVVEGRDAGRGGAGGAHQPGRGPGLYLARSADPLCNVAWPSPSQRLGRSRGAEPARRRSTASQRWRVWHRLRRHRLAMVGLGFLACWCCAPSPRTSSVRTVRSSRR